jgi:hypothetical protein
MKLSDIASLLGGRLSAAEFRAANSADFSERKVLSERNTRGGVLPVRVNEDVDVALNPEAIVTLCRLFKDGALTALELGYIADAMQLSDRVSCSDPDVRDYLDAFTDPEINEPFSASRAGEIIPALRGRI